MVWYLERTALRLPQVSHGGQGKNYFLYLVHELCPSVGIAAIRMWFSGPPRGCARLNEKMEAPLKP